MSELLRHYDGRLPGGGGDGGGGDGDGRLPPPEGGAPCPVVALGHNDGRFAFLDSHGQKRILAASALARPIEILALFGGDQMWLETRFPAFAPRRQPDGSTIEVLIGFSAHAAARDLMARCFDAGLFGDHVVERRPGIWSDGAGGIAVHAGDAIWRAGAWRPAGYIEAAQATIWPLAPAWPHPAAAPIAAESMRGIEARIRDTWRFAEPGGAMLLIGLVATALLGAAPDWRPNGFLVGEASSGKSSLLKLARALMPMHHYSNDTSKAGIEQAATGRAMPILIDEAADKVDQRGPQQLLELVLTATSGEGARVLRGTGDGVGRAVHIVGAIIMAAIAPPDMQPQHAGRFVVLRLLAPEGGEDGDAAMRALTKDAQSIGPALWARMLLGWPDWQAALQVLRAALRDAGCAPREQDQVGALLAGWWVATQDGVPSARQALDAVSAIGGFAARADELAAERAPRQVLQYLLTRRVQLAAGAEQRPVHELLARAWGDQDGIGGGYDPETDIARARRDLIAYGMRVIGAHDPPHAGRPPPRPPGVAADAEGVWLAAQSAQLDLIFAGTAWAGRRWQSFLVDLPARRSPSAIRFAANFVARGLWIDRATIEGEGAAMG